MDDPYLVELFVEEIQERAARLLRTARAWRDGEWRDDWAEEAERDAHTIKGNAAFMSDDELVDAGKLLERTWAEVRRGARGFDDDLAEALVRASDALVAASSSNRREADGFDRLASLLGVENPFEAGRHAEDEETFYSLARDLPDLGGLVVDSVPHFLDETAAIDSAAFGQLVDAIAQQRLDTEALIGALQESLGSEQAGEWQAATSSLLASVRELFDDAAGLTSAPVTLVTDTLSQLVRYIARRSGKDVEVLLEGEGVEADRYILDALREPIRHLVVNAVEHGIEVPSQRLAASKSRTGHVHIRFEAEDDVLTISVEDDGRGVRWSTVAAASGEPDALTEVLFRNGFSTMEVPSQFSGDGVGLALVARVVESLDGAVWVASDSTGGTRVTVRVPRLRAMQRVAIVGSQGQRWGLPIPSIVDVVEAREELFVERDGRRSFVHGDRPIPYAPLSAILGGSEGPVTEVVVVASVGRAVALGVEGGLQRVRGIAKQLGPSLAGVDLLSGAALLGGGDFVAMLDRGAITSMAAAPMPETGPRPKILVVDDSRAARQLLAASLTSEGFDVRPFSGGLELLGHPETWDASLIVTDLDMPGKDGVDLIESLRARGVEAPIAVLTGVGSEEELERALAAGADLAFEKAGLTRGAFVAAVRDLIKDRQETPKNMSMETDDASE